ncbi:uncharacterized protein MEPE_02866 [Melanopsichium pennsylvanicum]|uniref:Swi5-domain-containing protein n=2 Tax=Melanopsichium pennsylvanicum TaxID=63383 RepID=A0AAJ4XNA5_9BASI|nr:putative protein [Melanopsichium pennsylvanicum 4]SNX84158.1 uncharacterized protein MEPE_02866 [Melanopsichium pennsylvanicum]
MRRSASSSKASGSTPTRPRPGDSSAVLNPFKPLSGLESRQKPSSSPSYVIGARDNQRGIQQQEQSHASSSTATTSAARELRARSIAELEQEVSDMELFLNERLASHNATRKAKGLPNQQPEQIVSEYIALLTQYNKVKDSAQLIFDKIADIEQLPAKEIHARYGVDESDSSA